MQSKNILIICWDFPPNNAIGGRRWAKIAKSLIKLGHKVSVITKEPAAIKPVILPWISEEVISKITFYFCKPHLLTEWLVDYHSTFKLFKIRVASFLLSKLYKGTKFDKALGIEKEIISLASSIIKQDNIQTVFVSGAPFNLLYYSAKLKAVYPEVEIIADYRDPWIEAKNYGMQGLSVKKKSEELEKQNYVFENVAVVTAPNRFLLEEIRNSYTGKNNKLASFIELPHAFDPDDVISLSLKEQVGEIKRIVYAGTLYIGIEPYLDLLNKSINFIKLKDPTLLPEIIFYTNEIEAKKYFVGNEKYVNFEKQIGNNIFKEIEVSDFVFILLSEHNRNYVTSKFFEFLPYNKPYIYLGPEGYVSDKILKEKLGYVLKRESDLYDLLTNKEARIVSERDINRYSFDQIVENFLSLR